MHLSLSGRIAIGFACQGLVMVCSTIYIGWISNSLLEDFTFLKERFDPVLEEIKSLSVDVKTVEEVVSNQSQRYKEIKSMWKRMKVLERVDSIGYSLNGIMEWDGIDDENRVSLRTAVEQLTGLKDGDNLVIGYWKNQNISSNRELLEVLPERLVENGGGNGVDSDLKTRDTIRILRIMRGIILRIGSNVLSAERGATQILIERRSDVTLGVISVSLGAILVAFIVLLVSLRALRSLSILTKVVHRIANGDYSHKIIQDIPSELEELSKALHSLSQALAERERAILRKNEELRKSERLAVVGRMASVVAHEIRNPLNSISMNVDLLRDMLNEKQNPQVIVDAIQAEVQRLSDITEEYLRFGRMPKGEIIPCELVGIVKRIVDFLAKELDSLNIYVEFEHPQETIMVVADEDQLRQALLNVIRNSMEAMPNGGRVSIRISREESKVKMEIEDNGQGIPKEFMPRLFEPFATTKSKGTGLGLAFVQQVMHECGGDVTIESTEGKGTIVRMVLRTPDKK